MTARPTPLITWLLIQTAALSIGAMRVALSARAETGPQHFALAEMIVLQLSVGTMLFPFLMREGAAAAVALSTIPFLLLAGFLTATPIAPLTAVSLAMLIWFLGLRLLLSGMRSQQHQLVVIAILNCFVMGTPLLAYLIREFSESSDQSWLPPQICDPLTSFLATASSPNFSASCFIAPTALAVLGTATLLFQRTKFFRAKLSTSRPPV